MSQKTGKNYRLPTEAEWEYAAGRASNSSDDLESSDELLKWAGTNNENELGEYAWYSSNSKSQTHEVGTKKPNPSGLYDMSGNVWEWCADWYSSSYYSEKEGATTH